MTQIEQVTIMPNGTGGLWEPKAGVEVTALMLRKDFDDDAAAKVVGEAGRILSMCLPPDARCQDRAGLVIGYVQSGKTLSFTTVTALARDNRYRLVVVLAGTKTNLLDQNEERLTGDLGILEERGKFWRVLVNPRPDVDKVDEVQSTLDLWDRYKDRPERCRTLLIVVMKNAARLGHLTTLLSKCNLTSSCALVIDDEGDQAGLNTKVRQNDESATYASILGLRNVLPAHTYLQYTATPQAPLLISRIDRLSPEFAELLKPGNGYVGGKHLFDEGSPYVELIPADDLPDVWPPDNGPPPSLEKAMRLFFIGVAAGVIAGREGYRSMMIHPSHLRGVHESYASWARSIRKLWLDTLREPEGSPDRGELRGDFLKAYDDIAATADNLPPFNDVWHEMDFAIEETKVQVVNASNGRIESFPWSDSYGWILVGGAGLDRGFTVEGLTVTYMPRGAGTGMADTIQQRARFFGYKRSYMGLVRIFVDSGVRHAFTAYVKHEETLRNSLEQHQGKPMRTWRRLFFLDSSLKPTRRSVMALDIMRGRARDWIDASRPHSEEIIDINRKVVDTFVRALSNQWQSMPGSEGWADFQKHEVVSGLPLQRVYEELLVPLTMADDDDVFDQILVTMQVRAILEDDPNALCDVYLMSGGKERERAITEKGEVQNPFQGANPSTGYPGDREVKTPDRVSIQIHKLKLHKDKTEVASDVRLVATHIPEPLREDIASQDDA
ncbi:Z1 domain-containing protein [Mesorhizobium abyssinicae]|uniref:Z1 domain-containing protein n=1 Tax=Mesorhizobium abyssinicae TaxID=1209958 RepID=A0ABU5AW48_9HYPH|nr:Z1 domain-containing protein [Mesorhizobium abyssinicae]MDX8541478.1 Z1 domain-containing protein [Mesorhizobium abyssinicae]